MCNVNKYRYFWTIFTLLEMLLERHDIMQIKDDSRKKINYYYVVNLTLMHEYLTNETIVATKTQRVEPHTVCLNVVCVSSLQKLVSKQNIVCVNVTLTR